VSAKVELSSRATFHSIFALTIILLISIKVSFIRIYKKFYGKAQTIGLLIALITFGMVGTSGIYYLLVSELGVHKTYDTFLESKKKRTRSELKVKEEKRKIVVKTDSESIKRGKNIFEKSCSFCHDPYSEKAIMGPGLKGVLKNTVLPATKNEATPENIIKQLRNPYKQMPSFAHLQEDEVSDIISFLNTL
jgi:cytochrome c2